MTVDMRAQFLREHGFLRMAERAVEELDGLDCADATCVDGFIRSLGRRAFRRPLTPEEAAIFEEDGITLVQKTQLLGQEGLAFKVNKEYIVRAKFSAKKFSSFGSYPKYMGIKLSEDFVAASENTKQAYKVRPGPEILIRFPNNS